MLRVSDVVEIIISPHYGWPSKLFLIVAVTLSPYSTSIQSANFGFGLNFSFVKLFLYHNSGYILHSSAAVTTATTAKNSTDESEPYRQGQKKKKKSKNKFAVKQYFYRLKAKLCISICVFGKLYSYFGTIIHLPARAFDHNVYTDEKTTTYRRPK